MIFQQNVNEILNSFLPKNEYEQIAISYLKNLDLYNSMPKSFLSDAKKYDKAINKFSKRYTSNLDFLLIHYYQQKKECFLNDIIDEEVLVTSFFILNKDAQFVETAYNWAMIKQNSDAYFGEKNRESYNNVVLIFKVQHLRVYPYYLSNLEYVLCEVLKNEKNLKKILLEVIEYFDKEEVEKEYESFKKMVIDKYTFENSLCYYCHVERSETSV
jgi:hypothetical protein